MGIAFRMMVYMLLFNVSVGIIAWAGAGAWVASGTNPDTWQANDANIDTQFGRSVVLPAESSQNFWYRFLDIISLGLFEKIQVILNTTIFGFPALLNSMGFIPSGMMVFLDFILGIIYLIGFVELFSGKDLTLR